MPARASNVIPADALRELKLKWVQIRADAVRSLTAAQSPMTYYAVRDTVMVRFRDHWEALGEFASIDGLREYAEAQENDAAYDVVAEFQAVRAAVLEVAAWVLNSLPVDGNGFLLVETKDADRVVPRSFTAASLAPLRTRLQAVIDSIV